MKKLAIAVLLFPILAAATLQARQDTPWPKAAAVDAAVAEEMKKQVAVGAAVGVIDGGRIVHLKGYGLADGEKNLPVTTETMFRWASVSKPLTAVAAMQLAEKGLLDLGKNVREYVPEFPDHGEKLTARQLLCHQAGIVHYANGKVVRTVRTYDRKNPFEDVVLALDNFKESPLVSKPGEKHSYSTHGYILLSAVVERAGKQKFADQVKERISVPLGMKTLQPDYQWKDIPNRTVGYRMQGGVIVRSGDTDVSWKLGGGGFISSIEDMAKFAQGLLDGKLVSQATAKEMWTAPKTSDGKATNYALGFGVGRHAQLGRVISHSGAQEKTRTWLAIFPDQKRGVVVMTNSEYANPGQIAAAVEKAAWK